MPTCCAHAHAPMSNTFEQFPFCNLFKTKTCRYEVNDKRPECHECKRHFRLQKEREQKRTREHETKRSSCGRRLQLRREPRKSLWDKEKSQWLVRKHRSDSKLNGSEMPADVSVKQPNKGLAGSWMKTKLVHDATTATQPATKVLTQPSTSYSEALWAKTSRAWTWNPYPRGYFLWCWKNPFDCKPGKTSVLSLNMPGHFPFRCYHSNTDCMKRRLKNIFYAICVKSRFDFQWGNRTLSDWDSKLFGRKFNEVIK